MWISLASYCLVYNNQLETEGLAAARQAVVLAPEDPTALDLLGQILVELGDNYSADRFFWRAIQSNPGYAPVYLHRGVMYLNIGDREKAYEALHRVLDLAADQLEGQQAQRLLGKYNLTAQP
jgi:tetratricopeptide (TPR) repeat protein